MTGKMAKKNHERLGRGFQTLISSSSGRVGQLKVNYRFVPCFTTILPADGSDVMVLALFTDDNPCAEARFQRSGVVYELSTVRH
jgi:hypothetical protein